MKLIAKKNGKGYVSSYTLNISLKLARQNDLLNEDGTSREVELKESKEGIIIIPVSDTKENVHNMEI